MSCPSCPLCRQRVPDDLDAEVVAQLLELLYAIADHFEHRYRRQLLRYYAEHRDPPQAASSHTADLLADDDDLPF